MKASGNAIAKACVIADVLRRRIKGLGQLAKITHIKIVDEYEPLEEGLDFVTIDRFLSVIEITLSTKEMDKTHYGY